MCVEVCPHKAIRDDQAPPFEVDKMLCVECGACMEECPLGAIVRTSCIEYSR